MSKFDVESKLARDLEKQRAKVAKKEAELKTEQKKLQAICTHSYPDGRSAFPPSISSDCRLCGISNHDV